MRLIFFLLLVFVLGQASIVSAVSVSSTHTPEQPPDIAMVKASHLNVRTGPGVRFQVLQSLPKGTAVTLLEPEQDGVVMDNETWSKVTAKIAGTTVIGWVCDRYLEDSVAEPGVTPVLLPKDTASQVTTSPSVAAIVPKSRPTSVSMLQETGSALLTDTPADPALPELPELLSMPLKVVSGAPQKSDSAPETQVKQAQQSTLERSSPLSDDQSANANGNRLSAASAAKTIMEVLPTPLPDIIDKSLLGPASVPRPASALSPTLPEAPKVPKASEAGLPEADVLTTAPRVESEPLTYETLRFQCRRGFFFAGVESCTADINVILSLPPEFLAFAGSVVPVTCNIGFAYKVADEAQERTERYEHQFEVELVEGRGEHLISQKIDFAFRLNDVKDVRLEETSCIAGK